MEDVMEGFTPLEINLNGDDAWPELRNKEFGAGMATHVAVLPIPPEYAKALRVPSEPRVQPAGSGWAKVTVGRGSPGYGHSELRLDDVVERG